MYDKARFCPIIRGTSRGSVHQNRCFHVLMSPHKIRASHCLHQKQNCNIWHYECQGKGGTSKLTKMSITHFAVVASIQPSSNLISGVYKREVFTPFCTTTKKMVAQQAHAQHVTSDLGT
jgi:hypothetical protein